VENRLEVELGEHAPSDVQDPSRRAVHQRASAKDDARRGFLSDAIVGGLRNVIGRPLLLTSYVLCGP
ncbi:MAG TPA: hypothetical protein VFE45_04935, partial [Coriobacteriia bacterium]|nr:hypothetical protein [Coriobacteriia bacterium]